MVYFDSEPEGFNKKFEVTSLFLNHAGEILLLHRQDHKPQGNTWGVPAGKIEEGETPTKAIIRELSEETAIAIPENELVFLGKLYVQYPDLDFVYHMYGYTLEGERPEVVIDSTSHKAYKWIAPKDAMEMDLIEGLSDCINAVYP